MSQSTALLCDVALYTGLQLLNLNLNPNRRHKMAKSAHSGVVPEQKASTDRRRQQQREASRRYQKRQRGWKALELRRRGREALSARTRIVHRFRRHVLAEVASLARRSFRSGFIAGVGRKRELDELERDEVRLTDRSSELSQRARATNTVRERGEAVNDWDLVRRSWLQWRAL